MAQLFPFPHGLVSQQSKSLLCVWHVGADIGSTFKAKVAVAAPVLSAVVYCGIAGIDDLSTTNITDCRLCVYHFPLTLCMYGVVRLFQIVFMIVENQAAD